MTDNDFGFNRASEGIGHPCRLGEVFNQFQHIGHDRTLPVDHDGVAHTPLPSRAVHGPGKSFSALLRESHKDTHRTPRPYGKTFILFIKCLFYLLFYL